MSDVNDTLARIQSELKAPKGQKNTFGNYNFRNCEDILEALKPLLKGCTVTLSDDMQLVGDRVYVKATATLTDKSGSTVLMGHRVGPHSSLATGTYCLNVGGPTVGADCPGIELVLSAAIALLYHQLATAACVPKELGLA